MFAKTMDFSEALKLMKQGKRVTRKWWNGNIVSFQPDMYVWLEKPWTLRRDLLDEDDINTKKALGRYDSIDVLGTFVMKTRDNKLMQGWLATNTDLLAEDWIEVE